MKPRRPIGQPRSRREFEAREREIAQDFVKGLEEELRADLTPIGFALFNALTTTYVKSKAQGSSESKAKNDAYLAAKSAALFAIAHAGGGVESLKNDRPHYDIKKLKFDPHGARRARHAADEIAQDISETEIPAWNIDEHRKELYRTAHITAFCTFAVDQDETNARAVAIDESARYMAAVAVGPPAKQNRIPNHVLDLDWDTEGYYTSFRKRVKNRLLRSGKNLEESMAGAENAVRIVLIREAFDPGGYYSRMLNDEGMPDIYP